MKHFTGHVFFSFQMQMELSLADVRQWFHILPQTIFSRDLLLGV